MRFNKKAQNVIPILIGVMLVILIFSIGFMTESEKNKITGAVTGMEEVTGYGSLDDAKNFLEKNRLSGGIEFRLSENGEWRVYLHGGYSGFKIKPFDLFKILRGLDIKAGEPIDMDSDQIGPVSYPMQQTFGETLLDLKKQDLQEFPSVSDIPLGTKGYTFDSTGITVVDEKGIARTIYYNNIGNPTGDMSVLNTFTGEITHTTLHIPGSLQLIESACFLPSTPITLANGNKKQIQNIIIGDKILSYDLANNKPVESEVLNTFSHLENEYSIVNDKIKVTPYHNMFINGGWKQIGDAEVGDKLMDKDGNEVLIESIEEVYDEKGVMVYDLEIDKFHYYFAEGVLVHNSESPDNEIKLVYLVHGVGPGEEFEEMKSDLESEGYIVKEIEWDTWSKLEDSADDIANKIKTDSLEEGIDMENVAIIGHSQSERPLGYIIAEGELEGATTFFTQGTGGGGTEDARGRSKVGWGVVKYFYKPITYMDPEGVDNLLNQPDDDGNGIPDDIETIAKSGTIKIVNVHEESRYQEGNAKLAYYLLKAGGDVVILDSAGGGEKPHMQSVEGEVGIKQTLDLLKNKDIGQESSCFNGACTIERSDGRLYHIYSNGDVRIADPNAEGGYDVYNYDSEKSQYVREVIEGSSTTIATLPLEPIQITPDKSYAGLTPGEDQPGNNGRLLAPSSDYMSSDQLNLELSYRLQGQDVSNLQNTLDYYSIGKDGTLVGKIGENKIMMVTMDGYIIYGTKNGDSTSWEIQEGVTGEASSATEDVVLYRLGLDPNSVEASSVEKYYGNIITVAYDDITQKQINDFRHEMEVKYGGDDEKYRAAMVLAEEVFLKEGKKPDSKTIISQIEQSSQAKIGELSGQQLRTQIFSGASGSDKSAPTEFYMSIITGGEEKLDSPRLPQSAEILTWTDLETNRRFQMQKGTDDKYVISESKIKDLEEGEVQYEPVGTVSMEAKQAQKMLTELTVLVGNSQQIDWPTKLVSDTGNTYYDAVTGKKYSDYREIPVGSHYIYTVSDVGNTRRILKAKKLPGSTQSAYDTGGLEVLDIIPEKKAEQVIKEKKLTEEEILAKQKELRELDLQLIKNSYQDANTLKNAIDGWGTDEKAIEKIFQNIDNLEELYMLELYYKSRTGNDLMDDLKGDLTKKEFTDIVDRYLVDWIIDDSDKDLQVAYKDLQDAKAEYLDKKNKDNEKVFKEAQETYREAIKAKLAETNPLAKARIEVEEARVKLQEAEGKAIEAAKERVKEMEAELDRQLKGALGDDYYSSKSDPSNYEDRSTFWKYQECYKLTGECYSKVEAQNARQDALVELGKQDPNKLAEIYLEGLSGKERDAELRKLSEGFGKFKDKVTAEEYLTTQILAKQTLKEMTNAGAYRLTSQLLGATLGPWAFEKVTELCEEEWDASEPVTDTPTNTNPGIDDPANPTNETGCPEPFTTLTAQGTKTEAASKFSYDISWTIAPCKEDTSFDVYLANTETDKELIWSDKAEKGKPKAGRKKFSKDKDYKDVCIKVSDYSIGNRGYVCFPMV